MNKHDIFKRFISMQHSEEHEQNFREKQPLIATEVTTQTASSQVPEHACVGAWSYIASCCT